jgi:hypothetical protein
MADITAAQSVGLFRSYQQRRLATALVALFTVWNLNAALLDGWFDR